MTSLPVIIIGVNSFALEVADIFQKNNVVIYGFLDDDPKKKDTFIGEIPVLGTTEDEQYWGLIGKNCNVFVALENQIERKKMIETIIEDCKTKPTNAIHPNASVADIQSISYGLFIGDSAIIQPAAKLNDHVIIGAGAIIETGAILEEFAQVGSGTVVGKEARLENNCYIGINSTIVGSVKIGKSASIGAGSVVIESVPNNKRAFGNPAKIV